MSNGQTILFIEEDEEFRTSITVALEATGFEVVAAANPSNAFELLTNRASTGAAPLYAVICSWIVSNDEVLGLLQRIRQSEHKATPFVLLCGSITREQLVPALKADPDGLLLKPFAIQVLMKKLEEARKARETKELADVLGAL